MISVVFLVIVRLAVLVLYWRSVARHAMQWTDKVMRRAVSSNNITYVYLLTLHVFVKIQRLRAFRVYAPFRVWLGCHSPIHSLFGNGGYLARSLSL